MSQAETLRTAGVTIQDQRVPPRPHTFQPEGIILHWTASRPSRNTPAPSLTTVQHGRRGIPGPLYHWLVGRDGVWRWISDGYANHAGRGNTATLDLMAAGKGPVATARERNAPDTNGGGNRRTLGVALENSGNEELNEHLMHSWVTGIAALCRNFGWGAGHVISHAAYTSRKQDWPSQQMVRFRAAVLEELEPVNVGPNGAQEPRFNPPVRIDARWRDWCVVENSDGTHGLVALGEVGDIYAFNTRYNGAPNNEILGRKFTVLGDPVRVRAVPGGYEVVTDLGYGYGYTSK